MIKDLYMSATGTTGIQSIQLSTAHNAATAVAIIEATDTTLQIGDSVTVELGYTTSNQVVFRGFVKTRDFSSNNDTVILSAQDVLVRAIDFFIASSDPELPFKRSNIQAETLVQHLLGLAGIVSYSAQPTSSTFATQHDLEINLIGCYDICKQIADILAWHIYADENSMVHFVDRKPHIVSGDVATTNITDNNILSSTYNKSVDELRNRVVVYGRGDIKATAQASSSYLPMGFL